MGTLTYSHTLTAGTPENINDVQDMFNDAKTVINGNISGVNAPTLVGYYRTAMPAFGFVQAAQSGTLTPRLDGVMIASGGTSTFGHYVWPIIAADWAVAGMTTKLRLRVITVTNLTAPGVNFTYGLYPIASTAGGASQVSVTVGTVVSGSTVTRSAPASASNFVDVTSDFSLPSGGAYVPGLALSGATAASSQVDCAWELQVRNV